MPQLVLIDGGLGQLNAAMAAIDALGLDLNVAALAKREEELWTPGSREGLRLDASDPAQMVLCQARDEAHRFALSRHRRRRGKRALQTELPDLPGVGPARAKALLSSFGSVRGVRAAPKEELQALLGPRLGAHVWKHLHALGLRS